VFVAVAAAAGLSSGSHAVLLPATSAGTAGCGFERWPVKTLADAGARSIRLGSAQARSVQSLVGLTVAQGGRSSRGGAVERTVFRVHARLRAAKVESDSDIHLEIADPTTQKTMIAELPAFGCTRGATAAARKLMEQARAGFLKACGDPGSDTFTTYQPASATITGVGFFDFKHGQRGVAKNAIELHPVTAIKVVGCR
jgi:hypothetical protein